MLTEIGKKISSGIKTAGFQGMETPKSGAPNHTPTGAKAIRLPQRMRRACCRALF